MRTFKNTGAMTAALCALFVLGGCAALRSPVYDSKATKCHVVDSTAGITAEEHARVFAAVGDSIFPACPDSASADAWTYDARIRPEKFTAPSPARSWIGLGIGAALWGAGGGLAVAQENALWLMLPGFSPAPYTGISYRGDYLDKNGKPRHASFGVGEGVWFKTREESKAVALEAAPPQLAAFLFGVPLPAPKQPDLFGRAAVDIGNLASIRSNGGVWLDLHFEKFLPYRFTFDVSPSAFFPFSIDDRIYSLYAGPRWYPFSARHAGLFVGVEPYAETRLYRGETFNRYALPVTFGIVSQPKNFLWGLDFGVGPATTAGGAYEDEHIVLGSLYVGWAF